VKSKAGDVAVVALAFLFALGVKAFYSHAGASELAFILAPSCWLAAHVGGIDLVAEDGAGFISHAHRMVVGPACAGMNFFIIAFLAVFLSRRLAGFRDGIRAFPIAIVVAYVATILTNGLRIILAAHLFQLGGAGWFTPERIHRLAGVVIYCVALVLLCRAMAPGRRSLIIPIACYMGMAIGLPFLNGAARNRLFVEHALVVTAVSLLVLAVAHAATARRWLACLSRRNGRDIQVDVDGRALAGRGGQSEMTAAGEDPFAHARDAEVASRRGFVQRRRIEAAPVIVDR
jgi:exosortase K